ncbi:hypothetical protein VTI28DRAFT_8075 [Corynascus sepedonium]
MAPVQTFNLKFEQHVKHTMQYHVVLDETTALKHEKHDDDSSTTRSYERLTLPINQDSLNTTSYTLCLASLSDSSLALVLARLDGSILSITSLLAMPLHEGSQPRHGNPGRGGNGSLIDHPLFPVCRDGDV